MFNTKPWNPGFPGIPKEVEQEISNLQSRTSALETANTYSSTETVIGKWTDGQQVYRKVIDIGTLPNNTNKTISSGLSNITVRKLYGMAQSTSAAMPLPYSINSDTDNVALAYYRTSNNVLIITKSDRSDYSGFVVIEYTKNPPTRDGDTELEKNPEEVKEPETKTTKKAKKGE